MAFLAPFLPSLGSLAASGLAAVGSKLAKVAAPVVKDIASDLKNKSFNLLMSDSGRKNIHDWVQSRVFDKGGLKTFVKKDLLNVGKYLVDKTKPHVMNEIANVSGDVQEGTPEYYNKIKSDMMNEMDKEFMDNPDLYKENLQYWNGQRDYWLKESNGQLDLSDLIENMKNRYGTKVDTMNGIIGDKTQAKYDVHPFANQMA